MGKEILSYVVEKTHELIDTPICSSKTKATVKAWLDTIGTENEVAETKRYIDELGTDIMPINGLIGLVGSDAGSQVSGSDKVKDVAAHVKEIKTAGTKFCDCPAYAVVEAVPSKKEDLLK